MPVVWAQKGAATTATEKAAAWRVGGRLEGLRGGFYVLAWGTANGEGEVGDIKDRHGSEVVDCVSARKDIRCRRLVGRTHHTC